MARITSPSRPHDELWPSMVYVAIVDYHQWQWPKLSQTLWPSDDELVPPSPLPLRVAGERELLMYIALGIRACEEVTDAFASAHRLCLR